MSIPRIFATTKRILIQLHHDKRTIALALLVPSVLMVLLKYVFENSPRVFEQIAPMILGVFPFTIMFIIASISMLRERKGGTLDRLMTLPLTKFELIAGYAIAFGILAAAQAALACFVTLGLLDVQVMGGWQTLLVIAIMAGTLGMALGLITSSLAQSEFQAVQFLPAFVFPQFLVCGLLAPFEQMARPLQLLADITPLYYLVKAMRVVTTSINWPITELSIVGIFFVGSVIIAAISIRNKT